MFFCNFGRGCGCNNDRCNNGQNRCRQAYEEGFEAGYQEGFKEGQRCCRCCRCCNCPMNSDS